jgi:hypothetical protein
MNILKAPRTTQIAGLWLDTATTAVIQYSVQNRANIPLPAQLCYIEAVAECLDEIFQSLVA